MHAKVIKIKKKIYKLKVENTAFLAIGGGWSSSLVSTEKKYKIYLNLIAKRYFSDKFFMFPLQFLKRLELKEHYHIRPQCLRIKRYLQKIMRDDIG